MLQSTKDSSRPTVEFQPFAPGFDEDPYPAYEPLRSLRIAYWEQGRTWLVNTYDDILAVFRDKRFTNDPRAWELAGVLEALRSPELDAINHNSLFAMTDQAHARARKLVSPSFTPRSIERTRPMIQGIVDSALDAASGKETLNLVHDFAERIPVRVISTMLHIPEEHDELFHRFAVAAIRQVFPGLLKAEDIPQLLADIREGYTMLSDVIEDRRKNPIDDDILTSLIQAEEQGDTLTKPELISLVATLIVGGSDTTVHLIGFTSYNLLRRPELVKQINDDPGLLKGVLEEVLRFDNSGKVGLPRYATEDVEFAGVKIKKGEMLMLMLQVGMRDGSAFPNPDQFDPGRDTTGLIAFGNGPHYCLGANLARLEGVIAIGSLFRRFPQMTLLEPPTFAPHPAIRKMDTLKVRMRPLEA